MRIPTRPLSLLLTPFFVITSFVASFGRLPRGERLERIKQSPNYSDGQFQNLAQDEPGYPGEPPSRKWPFLGSARDLLAKPKDLRPAKPVPAIKTDLHALDRKEDTLVWLGHDTVFLQLDGMRFLVDPTLVKGSPVSFINRAFPAEYAYTPDDIPDIDYLLVSHVHWDHLDYGTVKSLQDRIGTVVCGLGAGEYFEYWKFPKEKIIELDWNEKFMFGNGLAIHVLPARHRAQRGLTQNKTLWVSFLLEAPSRTVFISGDTGYGSHFAEIGKKFPDIDLAIMENGQYDERWPYSHLMLDDLVKAIKELDPARVLTMHHAKYALANHAWYEPLDNISATAEAASFSLLTPMIGEPVRLNDPGQKFSRWWVD